MVLKVAVSLSQLCSLVGGVACKEQIVARLDHPRKAHEQDRVHRQGCGHVAGDHLGILLEISNGSKRKSPVGNYSTVKSAPLARSIQILRSA